MLTFLFRNCHLHVCLFQSVTAAGHHVYADRADVFNKMVNDACALSDARQDVVTMTTKKTQNNTKQIPLNVGESKEVNIEGVNISKELEVENDLIVEEVDDEERMRLEKERQDKVT